MGIFKVGDRVVIREWDDMAAEFGVDSDNDINCRMTFIEPMRYYCGQTATVFETTPSGSLVKLLFDDPNVAAHSIHTDHKFSEDMIALVEDMEDVEEQCMRDEILLDFLNG